MIPNGEGYHYLAVKKLSELLREITSKNIGDFHCSICFHSFRTKIKFESHKKVCENQEFCNVVILSGVTKILKFNQYQNSDKAPLLFMQTLSV